MILRFATTASGSPRWRRRFFADAIKDHDRIIDTETDNGQGCRQEEGVQFPACDQVHDRQERYCDEHVVNQRRNRSDAVADGMGYLAKRESDVGQNQNRGGDDGQQGRPADLCADGRADAAVEPLIEFAEAFYDRLLDQLLLGDLYVLELDLNGAVILDKERLCVGETGVDKDAAYIGGRDRLFKAHLPLRAAGVVDAEGQEYAGRSQIPEHKDDARQNRNQGKQKP